MELQLLIVLSNIQTTRVFIEILFLSFGPR